VKVIVLPCVPIQSKLLRNIWKSSGREFDSSTGICAPGVERVRCNEQGNITEIYWNGYDVIIGEIPRDFGEFKYLTTL
jgi:hypothetical protein